jgi:predicted  nucleic acid-binding Zn-ribbon protein
MTSPTIEQIAQRITATRDKLAKAHVEHGHAMKQISAWSEKADSAQDTIIALDKRLAALRRMISDEASR